MNLMKSKKNNHKKYIHKRKAITRMKLNLFMFLDLMRLTAKFSQIISAKEVNLNIQSQNAR